MSPKTRGLAIANLLLLALISISLAGCGSKTKSAITPTPAPTVNSFSASAPLLSPATTGQAGSKLSWEVTGASKLTIDNKVGDVTGTSVVVYPAATTTYTLTAANSIGDTATATVTVKVRNNLSVLNGTPFAGTDGLDYLSNLGICAYPNFLATDAAGNIYSTDYYHFVVCKITPNGNVTVLASNAQAESNTPKTNRLGGLLPSHIPMTQNRTAKAGAQASSGTVNAGLDPSGIVVTADGNTVYFADSNNHRIRKIAITSDGTPTVSDVAGGNLGWADGPGASAQFAFPMGLAMDAAGNLYVADWFNHAIRKIAFAADGSTTVSTLAGNPNYYGHVDGAADVAEFGHVTGIAASADEKSIYVTDYYSSDWDPERGYYHQGWYGIRKISIDAQRAATVSSVVGGGYDQDGNNTPSQIGILGQLALSSDGTVLYAGDESTAVWKIVMAGDGTAAVTMAAGTYNQMGHADGAADAAWFEAPFGVALDAAGNLYISSSYDNLRVLDYTNPMTLRKLALATNKVSSIVLNVFGNTGGSADDDGTRAAFNVPSGAVTDASGNIYVTDSSNSTIRKITIGTDGTSTVSTLAGTAGVFGSADGTGAAASFDEPVGLAIDTPSNSLYIADMGNGTIRKIDLTTAAVTTVAGTAGQHNSGGIGYPWRLAVDSTGVVYVSDIKGGPISKVDPATGKVTVLDLADSTNGFAERTGLAIYTNKDKSKSYLYAARGCAVFQIDLLAADHKVTTLAGSNVCGYQDGAANAALFADIRDISVDSQGNLYVVDTENSVIRRVTPDGITTTVVGTYPSTIMTLGSLPGSLYLPLGVALDPTDNLLITVPNAVLTLTP